MKEEALRLYLNYQESEQEFEYLLSMEYEWDDAAYLHLIKLLTNVLTEYRESLVIPKSVAYFLASQVDRIVGLVSNDLFHLNPPAPYTKETYKALVDSRVKELLKLKKDFFAGNI